MKKPEVDGAAIAATEFNTPHKYIGNVIVKNCKCSSLLGLNAVQKLYPVTVITVAKQCGVEIVTSAQFVI